MDFAVLHGEHDVAHGRCESDVDIVTREPAHDVARRWLPALREQRLRPILIWPYDVGSASVFVVDELARHGAQIDMLFDLGGHGRYGVRSRAVLDAAVQGVTWPRATALHEALYLLRKRQAKGQPEQVAKQVAAVRRLSDGTVHNTVEQLFSAAAAAKVLAAVREDQPSTRVASPRDRTAATLANRIARIRHPVGFWVHLTGADARQRAEHVASRFRPILPVVESAGADRSWTGMPSRTWRIARVRWRAGLFATWGGRTRAPTPDLTLHAPTASADDDLAALVHAMEGRLRL